MLWNYQNADCSSILGYIFISIHQAGSNINNNNIRKFNYKHLTEYYKLLQNWQKPLTVEIYRSINLSCLLLRTQLGRSMAQQLWQSFTTSMLPVLTNKFFVSFIIIFSTLSFAILFMIGRWYGACVRLCVCVCVCVCVWSARGSERRAQADDVLRGVRSHWSLRDAHLRRQRRLQARPHRRHQTAPQGHPALLLIFTFLPARRYASAGTRHGPVSVCLCLSVCPSQVGVLKRRLNESSWLWHGSFLPPIPHCVNRKFGSLQK